MKASEIAFQAAQIMSERGHCKHLLEDAEGRVCFSGALQAAAFGEADHWMRLRAEGFRDYYLSEGYQLTEEVFRAAEMILAERSERSLTFSAFPVEYNNRPDVTGEDVILLLKEAGARLEGEGK